MMRLDEAERIARLRLVMTDSVGPKTFHRFLTRYKTAQNAIKYLSQNTIKSYQGKPIHPISADHAARELAALDRLGGHMIVYGDHEYPAHLAAIENAPPVLFALGDVSLLSRPSIAIVGARNASSNAKRFASMIARDLGANGHIIVSGMARGIDTAAHKATIETGTVAVVAGGLDEIYPIENTDLYHQIIQNGCIVSEMPLGTKPTAHHFPNRNRIVSGLSRGTIIVEASVKSGSLITARMAAEQGREVFAVPGFPGDPRAAGPNTLIQQGAKLVTCADDVLQELTFITNRAIPCDQPDLLAADGEDHSFDNTPTIRADIIEFAEDSSDHGDCHGDGAGWHGNDNNNNDDICDDVGVGVGVGVGSGLGGNLGATERRHHDDNHGQGHAHDHGPAFTHSPTHALSGSEDGSSLGQRDGGNHTSAPIGDFTTIEDIHAHIIDILSPTPMDVDDIIRECDLSASTIHSTLLELELNGAIERHPGNRVSKVA